MYHICLPEDKYDFTKGYIGVSRRPRRRWSSGYRDSPHLKNAMDKYSVIKYVFLFGTERECLHKEKILRPKRNMGWNIAIGGGKPPSPKNTDNCISKLPKHLRRKNYKPSQKTLENMSKAQRAVSDKSSLRMKGESNPMYGRAGKDSVNFKGLYVTPKGVFESTREASDANDVSRLTVQRRCKDGAVVLRCREVPKNFLGKFWKELGWYFIDKEEL